MTDICMKKATKILDIFSLRFHWVGSHLVTEVGLYI